jgi:hypothetical protein
VVQELVGAGADTNRKNDKGIAPLFVFQFLSVSAHYRPYMLFGTLGTMRPPSHVLRSEPCPTFPDDHTHFLVDRSRFDIARC